MLPTDEPNRPRTNTRRRLVLVVPEDASPQVLAFANEVKSLLGSAFVVRVESANEEITPVETRLNDFPFVLQILG